MKAIMTWLHESEKTWQNILDHFFYLSYHAHMSSDFIAGLKISDRMYLLEKLQKQKDSENEEVKKSQARAKNKRR